MNHINGDMVLNISNYLNAKDINQYYQVNPFFTFILMEKNEENKQMVQFWLGSMNQWEKINPLRYFFINKSFKQFMFVIHTGLYDHHLLDLFDLNILQIAIRRLNFEKFKQVYDIYESKKLPITNMFLMDSLKWRRPSKDRTQIKTFLQEKQVGIKI